MDMTLSPRLVELYQICRNDAYLCLHRKKKNPIKANWRNQPISAEDALAAIGNTVYFGYDSSTLTDEAQATLMRQAGFLKGNPSMTVTIEGHCDERGTREYNLALGERRATAARDYLLAQGVNAARIRVISYGKERPVAAGSTESSWSKNRRAATVLN